MSKPKNQSKIQPNNTMNFYRVSSISIFHIITRLKNRCEKIYVCLWRWWWCGSSTALTMWQMTQLKPTFLFFTYSFNSIQSVKKGRPGNIIICKVFLTSRRNDDSVWRKPCRKSQPHKMSHESWLTKLTLPSPIVFTCLIAVFAVHCCFVFHSCTLYCITPL